MTFEWDENKNQENIRKHGISFDEAQEAFFDTRRIIRADAKHSSREKRWYCIGKINNDVITVRFTIRSKNIRIIGAGYWRTGRGFYEKKNNLY